MITLDIEAQAVVLTLLVCSLNDGAKVGLVDAYDSMRQTGLLVLHTSILVTEGVLPLAENTLVVVCGELLLFRIRSLVELFENFGV